MNCSKDLQLSSIYISGHNLYPSQKAVIKWLIEQLDMYSRGVICVIFLTGRHLLINKKDKNSRYAEIKIIII